MQLDRSTPRPRQRLRHGAEGLQEALDLLELACAAMPGGFAICRVVRDRSGKAVDFRVERANASLRRMTGREAAPDSQALRDALPPGNDDWIAVALAVFEEGRPRAVDWSAGSGTSCQLRFAAAAPERLTVLITDRTEFEIEKHRHAERLMELNHRTKNNLAIVAGMLRLQAGRTTDPAVREPLTHAANRIDAVSAAHTSLYRFGGDEVVDLGAYLTDLCDRLAPALVERGRVNLEVEAVPLLRPFEDVLPLSIIVNELVTNASKHAYPAPMAGTIHVRLGQTSDGIALTVSDEGCGLPVHPNGRAGGLGMQLVRSLVRQLDGHIEIRRGHPGTAFEVRLPRSAVQGDGSQERLL